jgi:hypothetical protein
MEQPPLPPENSESAPTTNKMAIRSMVLGIVGPIVASGGALACSEHQGDVPGTLMLVAGIGVMALVLAIIFGGTARRQIREAKGRERGKGMALAGVDPWLCVTDSDSVLCRSRHCGKHHLIPDADGNPTGASTHRKSPPAPCFLHPDGWGVTFL